MEIPKFNGQKTFLFFPLDQTNKIKIKNRKLWKTLKYEKHNERKRKKDKHKKPLRRGCR